MRAPTQEEGKKTGKRKRKREEVGGEKQKPTWPERGTGHEASFDDYIYMYSVTECMYSVTEYMYEYMYSR